MRNTRARTSYGSRSAYSSAQSTRTLGGTQSLKGRNLAQSEDLLQQANIHELKLQIYATKEKTKKLKSQNVRINQKIESNTNNINRSFEISAEGPQGSATIHKRTIEMLKKSIESAKINLNVLLGQIEKAKKDDRYWSVKETEQEVAFTYIEKKRIENEAHEEKQRSNRYESLYQDAFNVQSQENLSRLRQILRETKQANASLRDKLSAYRKKLQKTDIEMQILQHAEKKDPLKKVVEDAEVEQAEDHQNFSKMLQQLSEMDEEHEQKVQELQDIIKQQVETLQQFMKDNEEALSQNILEE